MMWLLHLVTDRYEREARVIPALLVVLPLLVPLVCTSGAKNAVLNGLVVLLVACGAIYAIASIARGRGKRLEETLVQRWGGMPATIALRHRDGFLDRISKDRYHKLIGAKLKVPMPTAEQERDDPDGCDQIYLGAVRELLERTRGSKGLLLKENIAYGFHRNMLAMKPVGITVCLLAIAAGCVLAGALRPTEPHVVLGELMDMGMAPVLTLAVSFALLAAWIFYFNEGAVRRIGFVYAERLFECLPTIKAKR